jgi:hypothetical protein
MMKATNKFPLEISVIHGTLRNQDLIPAFLEAVLQLDPDTPMALIEAMMPEELREAPQDNDDHEWWYTETAYWVLEHLDNKLNDYAPDGYYFGAHYGDGSDFGFWRILTRRNMDNKTEIVELNAQCDALIKKYLDRRIVQRTKWGHNLTRKSNGQKVLHKSKSVAEIKQFRRTT